MNMTREEIDRLLRVLHLFLLEEETKMKYTKGEFAIKRWNEMRKYGELIRKLERERDELEAGSESRE